LQKQYREIAETISKHKTVKFAQVQPTTSTNKTILLMRDFYKFKKKNAVVWQNYSFEFSSCIFSRKNRVVQKLKQTEVSLCGNGQILSQ
jgi:cell fate (sporulation/competence/biofilm development) regulator YmcA (YheA/YmcA/DUF963 family)